MSTAGWRKSKRRTGAERAVLAESGAARRVLTIADAPSGWAAYCAPSCFISVRLSSICQLAVILPPRI